MKSGRIKNQPLNTEQNSRFSGPFRYTSYQRNQQVVFVHCAGIQENGEGSSGLVAYLRSNLNDKYILAHPNMPEPENPRYKDWKEALHKELQKIDREVILIGHSLGGSVLLKYLSEEDFTKTIKGLFLIATPFWGLKNWEIDEFYLPKDFTSRFPVQANIYLYHSMGDEWVPVSHLKKYSETFPSAKVRIINGNEHEFYHGIPKLIEDIQNL